MKTNKMIRCLVAVLLVCVLLFSWSPVRAEAVTTGAVVSVAALTVIAGILIAEKIRPGSNFDEFNALVDLICDAAAGVGWVVNGFCQLFYDGSQTYVDVDFAQFVKDWLWGYGAVLETIGGPASFFAEQSITYSGYSITPHSDVLGFGIFNGSTLNLVLVSSSPFSAYRNSTASDTAASVTPSGNYYTVASKASKTNLDSLNVPILSGYLSDWGSYEALVDTFFAGGISSLQSSVSTDYDLTLGDVAGQDEDLATGYPEWHAGTKMVTIDGAEKLVYPVSTPATYEEAITQTPTEAQQGTTSITDDQIVTEGLDVPLAEVNTITFIDALGLSDLLVTMQALPQTLGATFTDALTAVFVPSADYLTVKVEALRERFGFIDSVLSTGEYLRDCVSGASGPPVIYVDLGAASGDINYGGKVLLTDFAWYEPYKPTVDSVLGAACWAFFGWRVFMRLPGIIGGESGYVESAVSLYHFREAARNNDSPRKKKE